jgi:hypothetical protein
MIALAPRLSLSEYFLGLARTIHTFRFFALTVEGPGALEGVIDLGHLIIRTSAASALLRGSGLALGLAPNILI